MAMKNYYNQFDENKHYKFIKFRASKGLQSTELNEIQSMFLHELNTISNTLYGDGSVLRGGAVDINGTNVIRVSHLC